MGPVLGGLLASLGPAPARAETCRPTVADAGGSLPATWRRALDELAARTARPGAPWACHGGAMRIVAIEGSSRWRLVVADPTGREKSQELETPDDVVPLGEALLAQPLGEETPPETAAAPAATEPGGPPPADPAAPTGAAAADATPPTERPTVTTGAVATTRRDADAVETPPPAGLVLGATAGPRLAIPDEVLTGALRVHALAPVGDVVVVGGWARVDGPSWALGDVPADTSTIGLGPSIGARLPLGVVEARVVLDPAAVVVVDRTGARDAELDARIGLGLDAIVPVTSGLGLVLGVDAELAPFRMGDRGDRRRGDATDPARRDAGEPPMPGALLGLRVGLEVQP